MKKTRIFTQQDIMLGKPIIRGTRITVELVLRKMVQGASIADLLEMYPYLTAADVRACLDYAADLAANVKTLSQKDAERQSKIQAMREAAQDPLYLSDLAEVQHEVEF